MRPLKRRDFLKAAGLGAAVFVSPLRSITVAKKKPNIVLILADDMGFSDLGCYGSEIHTPNLNALAAGGLRFTQFYNAARCCPTRASLNTGLYPHQAGVGRMVADLGFPGYRGFLNDRSITIAEALKQAGYATYMSGKWHLGEDPRHWPVKRGFDRYFGLLSGACSYWELLPGRKMAFDDQPWRPDPDDKSFYMTDTFTDHAIDFLDQHKNKQKPFFLYLAYTAPHWPLHAWPEDIAKYRGKYMIGWDELRRRRHKRMIELGIVEAKWPLSPRHEKVPPWDSVKDKDTQDLRMAVYAAMIDRMDQNIGRVVAKLKKMKQFDNTLILFLSDNGACHVMVNRGKQGIPPGPKGGFWGYDYPWANASNTPLRMFKQFAHEGGISTPLIVHWPDVIKNKNALTHQPGHIIDIMATCLDVAGIRYPKKFKGKKLIPLEGKSLLPIFKGGERKPHDVLYWEHVGNRAVRREDWKLVSTKNSDWSLYNLKEDRTELHDLFDQYPQKAKELLALYEKWTKKCGVLPFSVIEKRRKSLRSKKKIG